MRRLSILPLVLVVVACDTAGNDVASVAAAAPGAAYTLPQAAPGRFAFGAEASQARVALWDIDVKPDGEGLPAGSGTVAEGEAVWTVHCVSCHGVTGVEGPYDRLVGTDPWEEWPTTRTVGNYWPYATTLYDYIRKAMPQLTPGLRRELRRDRLPFESEWHHSGGRGDECPDVARGGDARSGPIRGG